MKDIINKNTSEIKTVNGTSIIQNSSSNDAYDAYTEKKFSFPMPKLPSVLGSDENFIKRD